MSTFATNQNVMIHWRICCPSTMIHRMPASMILLSLKLGSLTTPWKMKKLSTKMGIGDPRTDRSSFHILRLEVKASSAEFQGDFFCYAVGF